nr:hypothetical protein CIT39_29440 [Bradyrhizobium symbiodeficiens]
MRVLSSWGVPLRRHPLPSPPPQAGEGAHRPRGDEYCFSRHPLFVAFSDTVKKPKHSRDISGRRAINLP